MKSIQTKKGQIELTFNWVYILIAGTLILLFFVGLVFKQKASSEEKLTADVVEVLDSIFTGASVSEKTKHFIDTSSIADYTLSFTCEEGITDFGIKDSPTRKQNAVTPIFSLREMISPQMILWSLPYKLPFKVIDFLFVTSADTKYFLVGNDIQFGQEFLDATEDPSPKLKIKRESADTLDEIIEHGNLDLRIVDLKGSQIVHDIPLPANLQEIEEDRITAVSFAGGNVWFYQVKNGRWKRTNLNPSQIISLPGERDAAKYAAIFSADDEIYRCNMQKAFQRLEYLTEVYYGKTTNLINHYESRGDLANAEDCLLNLDRSPNNVAEVLGAHRNIAISCRVSSASGSQLEICDDLEGTAASLKRLNENLEEKGCVKLY